jgi:murein DD-endopeptidase MepM/ murein hydrolase activator NlpD
MTRKPDPLFNLADALSEEIVATPADALLHEAAGEPGGGASPVTSFDRIAARAAAQSRRRRIVERLRALLPAWPAPIGWRSAMAGVAGIFVMVIAGGLYLHQPEVQLASAPPPVVADRMAASSGLIRGNEPMSYAPSQPAAADRRAKVDHAAAEQPAPAAAPPVVAAAPPPAPPAAAGVADEPRRARTVEVRPDAAVPEPSTRTARKVAPPQAPAEDRLAKLAIAAEQKRSSTLSQAPRAAPAAPAASSYAPAASGPSILGGLAEAPPGFAWPLRGRVIAGFGSPVGGAPNQGIDLAVPAGTDIRAAEDGVVLYAGSEIKGLGNLLLLRHRDGFLTAYAHAQSFAVKPGDTVRRGQVIAKSGQSGAVTKPQLHFEIRKDSAPVDPARHLPPPG